ncbi:PQQ-dependent sugar dehydrogenase [Tautonia rosea]|uniref:PQQ-dependent sugar dehydrogenase n=1 Tax=Tautonia rosea TaxID=2728037 RepID=UPI001474B82F|nr:PQQ-dependent sugar dehydrogenase [Tautonia rosea]
MRRGIWPIGIAIGPFFAAIALLGAEGRNLDEPSASTITAEAHAPPQTVSNDSDAQERFPWTTSRMVGSPEPPRPYSVEVAFPHLTFDRPVELVSVPGTNRLAIAELGGKILTFPDDPLQAVTTDVMFDVRPRHPRFTNLYGLAFHPEFAQNGRLFVCYTIGHDEEDGTRVSEFRVNSNDPLRVDPDSERILITWYSGGHNGGSLKFSPIDGYLYISSGDGAAPSPPDPFLAGQDMTTLMSKVLRIDVDAQDAGLAYRVPPDNPFVDLPGARPEIWAYGFRNPWRMSFDREGGDLWLGDVGWELWELVHRIERGGNYGWSIMEGRQPVMPDAPRGPTPISPPIVDHPHSEAASVTGGFVYRGDRLAELRGAYIYGDFQTGTLWGLRFDGEAVTWHEVLAETPLRLVAFGEDRSGELYLLDYEQTNRIYRLVPNPDAAEPNVQFPRRLSETGLFASVADLEPAPGVLRYQINAPVWSDGTDADRLMAVPNLDRITWTRDGLWTYPDGSVFARTVLLDVDATSEGSSDSAPRRLETQVLHLEDERWRAYSYRWNEEQTDATLVGPEGESVTITLDDSRTITHRIAPRSECLLCHNPWAGEGLLFGRQSATPLTANTLQLNTTTAGEGQTVEQIRMFEHLGLFQEPLPEGPEALPRLANPYNEALDLDTRARSYLQVNCAHCHRFGAGGSANLNLTFDRSLAETGMLGVEPVQGSFGIDDARIVAPGDPFGSLVLFRMAKLGAGRMPRVGSSEVDVRALDLMHRWIAGLTDEGESEAPADPFRSLSAEVSEGLDVLCRAEGTDPVTRAAAFAQASASVRGALALLRRIDEGAIAPPVVEELVAMARTAPSVEVRDLFERFVPASDRLERLGESFDGIALLSLTGDTDRGRRLFLEGNEAQCRTCHRINGEGTMVGPDLDGIGAKYSRQELMHHIVQPSATVEPPYVSYLLATTDGQILTGMLVEQTAQGVALKDAKGQTLRVSADEVEELKTIPQSLMPEGLLAPLTPQQAADLLAFLSEQTQATP